MATKTPSVKQLLVTTDQQQKDIIKKLDELLSKPAVGLSDEDARKLTDIISATKDEVSKIGT